MLSTRSMGLLGGIALAPMGMVFAYQAFSSGGTLPVSAQTVMVKEAQPPRPEAPDPPPALQALNMPAIPVPVDPRPAQAEAPPTLPTDLLVTGPALAPLPGQSLPPLPMIDPGVVPASAQVPQPEAPPKLPPGPAPAAPPIPSPAVPPSPSGFVVPPGNEPGIQKLLTDSLDAKNQSPACPWTLNIEIVDGRTQLTAQHGREVKFVVSCEKLDVQTPAGAIHATGNVKLTTDSIEGCCDRLTLSWQADIVVLDKAQLKCKLEGHEAELNADQLRVRLSRVITVSDPGEPQSSRGVLGAGYTFGSPSFRGGPIVERRSPAAAKIP